MVSDKKPVYLLPIIVFSQFAGASMWFAGNAVIGSLQTQMGLPENSVGTVTSAVQFGFIIGTLLFAIFTIADRFSPVRFFFISSLLGALFNLSVYLFANDLLSVIIFRFGTGFFLAGIYPVGMKISADWYNKGLGRALGYLVGALVLGTAFPHLAKDFLSQFPWSYVLIFTSGLAAFGGSLMLIFVKDGPYRKPMQKFDFSVILNVFRHEEFRSAAFGYFGHMWELFTFWAFVPLILSFYAVNHHADLNISLMSFIIIGVGGISCVFGGAFARRSSSGKVAFISLIISCLCCLTFPAWVHLNVYMFIFLLLIWGMSVVSDSPQFSTLVAQTTEDAHKGTALTIVNCIGFAITIVSIQFTQVMIEKWNIIVPLSLLFVGPLFGILSIFKMVRPGQSETVKR